MIPHKFETPHTNGPKELHFVMEKLGDDLGYIADRYSDTTEDEAGIEEDLSQE